jgi:hypothetical protein
MRARLVVKLAPSFGGLLIAMGVCAAVFGLAQTLTKPRSALQLVANAVGELGWNDAVVGRARLGRWSFMVSCQPRPHGHSLVTIGAQARLLVADTEVHPFGGAVLRRSQSAAMVELAGCPRVLSRLLTTSVQVAFSRGAFVPFQRRGSEYWISLTRRSPLVMLEVNPRTLEPVGVRFYGRVLNGDSLIRLHPQRKAVG